MTKNAQPEMNNTITLVTGSRNDFLPDSSTVCIKNNGNLLFAGHAYTKSSNTTVEETTVVTTTSNTVVTWKVGSHHYSAGSDGSHAIINSDSSFGVLTVGTTGLALTNGDYSGSNITLGHTLNGSGTYTIIPQNTPLSVLLNLLCVFLLVE